MREAQEKSQRNPAFSDYKEKAQEAELKYIKAQLEEERTKNQYR